MHTHTHVHVHTHTHVHVHTHTHTHIHTHAHTQTNQDTFKQLLHHLCMLLQSDYVQENENDEPRKDIDKCIKQLHNICKLVSHAPKCHTPYCPTPQSQTHAQSAIK